MKRHAFLRMGLLAALGLVSCEDRRLAPVAVAHGSMREFRLALACRHDKLGGYPETLRDLATPIGGCPVVAWLGEQQPGDVQRPQPHRAYYDYFYFPLDCDQQGRPQRFGLMAAGPKTANECDVCRSFWLDESGVLRQAPGRAAGPGDEAVKD